MTLSELNLKLSEFHFCLKKNILGYRIEDANDSNLMSLNIAFRDESACYINLSGRWISTEKDAFTYKETFERYSKALALINNFFATLEKNKATF